MAVRVEKRPIRRVYAKRSSKVLKIYVKSPRKEFIEQGRGPEAFYLKERRRPKMKAAVHQINAVGPGVLDHKKSEKAIRT